MMINPKPMLLGGLLTALVLLGGCTTATVPEYSANPLAEIAAIAPAKQSYPGLHLGIIYSENSHKAIQHIEENRQAWFSPNVRPEAGPGGAERNPEHLKRDLHGILENRFADIVLLKSVDDAAEAGVNLIMVLDLRIVDKMRSYSQTIIEINTIFLDLERKELTRISAAGAEKVPYPAITVFRKTLNAALTRFRHKIDSSAELLQFASTFPVPTVATALASQPLNGVRLAVLDLEAIGVGDDVAFALSDYLRDTLQTGGGYEVLSRADLEAIAKRTSLQQQSGDCVDASCLVQFGKALGTKFMVAGSISKLGEAYAISLRLLDTEGANPGVKKRSNEICQCPEEELFGRMQNAAMQLMKKED